MTTADDGKTEATKQTRGEKIALLVINQLVSEYEKALEAGTAPDVPVWLAEHKELYDKFGADLARPIQGAWLIHERKRFLTQVRSIREYALAIVEGETEQEAFARGKQGEGTPLHDILPDAPLFDAFYASDKAGRTRRPEPAEWIRGLFAEHDGWQRADPTGLADRILKASNEKIRKHGVQWLRDWPEAQTWGLVDEALAWCDGIEGLGGRLPLGPDPNFARPCAQAIGLMLIEPLAPRALGVLNLPPKDGRRRFLFFGTRNVV